MTAGTKLKVGPRVLLGESVIVLHGSNESYHYQPLTAFVFEVGRFFGSGAGGGVDFDFCFEVSVLGAGRAF